METLSQVVGIVASLAAIAAPSAAAFGFAPRLGPLRAVVLALSTRFSRPKDVSLRSPELKILRSKLSTVHSDQYVVVCGPKGVGLCVSGPLPSASAHSAHNNKRAQRDCTSPTLRTTPAPSAPQARLAWWTRRYSVLLDSFLCA